MVEEVWKIIKDYPNYIVSNLGRVKNSKGRILKLCLIKDGYYQLCLSKDGISRHHLIHRLVAEAFIPNPNNYPIINHKDENPSNNCAENLEWCTHKYNMNYGNCNKRRSKSLKGKIPWCKGKKITNRKTKMVLQYNLSGILVNVYKSIKEIYETQGFSKGNICQCCNGKNKTAYGYIWKYKDSDLKQNVKPNKLIKKWKRKTMCSRLLTAKVRKLS